MFTSIKSKIKILQCVPNIAANFCIVFKPVREIPIIIERVSIFIIQL